MPCLWGINGLPYRPNVSALFTFDASWCSLMHLCLVYMSGSKCPLCCLPCLLLRSLEYTLGFCLANDGQAVLSNRSVQVGLDAPKEKVVDFAMA